MNPPQNHWKSLVGYGLLVLTLLATIPLGYQFARRQLVVVTQTPAPLPSPSLIVSTSQPTEVQPRVTETEPASIQASPASVDRVVYLESDPTFTSSTIWIAPLVEPASRQAVATLEHRQGYPPIGKISPDGSQIALLVIPPAATEQSARTNGGEIWVMGSDGANLRKIADQAGQLNGWTPDGASLAYSRLVPLETPADPNVPFRTEVMSVALEGGSQTLLYADETAYGVQPLGWDAGANRFWMASVDLQGQWQVLGWERASGKVALQADIPGRLLITTFSLSPDGSQVLMNATEGDQAALLLLDLQAKQTDQIASAPLSPESTSPFTVFWSGDGRSLLVQDQGRGGQGASLGQFTIVDDPPKSLSPVADSSAASFTPVGWSPDQVWVVLRDYQASNLPLYLQKAGDQLLLPLPRADAGNFVDLIGWLGN